MGLGMGSWTPEQWGVFFGGLAILITTGIIPIINQVLSHRKTIKEMEILRMDIIQSSAVSDDNKLTLEKVVKTVKKVNANVEIAATKADEASVRADAAAVVSTQNAEKIEEVRHATNSMKDALVQVTGEKEFARGHEMGKEVGKEIGKAEEKADPTTPG